MPASFRFETAVRLHQTDAAGLLFFARQFDIVHDCYESFLEKSGHSFAQIIRTADYLLPIVEASGQYRAALFAGDRLTISMSCERISDHSFILAYEITRDDTIVGSARTVHVCIDAASRTKKGLPQSLRAALIEIAPQP